ncbi:MAG: TonB-dependent receptor [Desulfobacterales bacterium]|nr:TonB-dependent receptor [Desulfobacterales bacterium]
MPSGGGAFDPIVVNYITGRYDTDINNLDEILRRDGDFESTVLGIYTQGRIGITDRLTSTLGLRYDYQERSIEDLLQSNPNVEASYDRFTPRIVFDYAFTQDVNGYVSYSEGFNPPYGVAFTFQRAGADELKPEVAKSYEIGLKTNLLNDTGYFRSAAYFMERRDLVQTLRIDNVNTQINAGGLDVWGLEFEAGMQLDKWIPGLSVRGNYSYTETEWKDYTISGTSFAGYELVGTPKHYASFTIDWESFDKQFGAGFWVDYIGESYANRINTVKIDGYAVSNVHFSWQPKFYEKLSLRAQVLNLFDKEYFSRTELDWRGEVLGGSPGLPLRFLLSASLKF